MANNSLIIIELNFPLIFIKFKSHLVILKFRSPFIFIIVELNSLLPLAHILIYFLGPHLAPSPNNNVQFLQSSSSDIIK